MSIPLTTSACLLAAYLAGSIPFGHLLAKRRGVQIQQQGSGNIGATNVARVLGKRLGALVLLLDVAKGAVAVAVISWLSTRTALAEHAAVASAVAAVAGHCYPIWLRFKGGKGVATALGVFLVLDAMAAGISVLVFASIYALARLSSAASLAAALSFPAILWLRGAPSGTIVAAVGIVAIVFLRHRDNLVRLRKGTEHKL